MLPSQADPRPVVPATASWPRRMTALMVDWAASSLVAALIVGPERFFASQAASPDPVPGLVTLGVFVAETVLLTSLSGGSFGKLATRLRVVSVGAGDGFRLGPVGPAAALIRTILVALVIPPLVFRPDGRGLHDLAARTATVTLDTAKAAR